MNRFSRFIALAVASLLLVLLTIVALQVVYGKVAASNAAHLHAQLMVVKDLSLFWRQRHLETVRALADQPGVRAWVTQKLDGTAVGDYYLSEHLRPFYLGQGYMGQGYMGHVLFDGQHGVISDSNRAYQQPYVIPEAAGDTLVRSQREGESISHPFLSSVPLRDPERIRPTGTLMQIACARVGVDRGEAGLLPVLCLRLALDNGLGQLLDKLGGEGRRVFMVDKEGVPLAFSTTPDDAKRRLPSVQPFGLDRESVSYSENYLNHKGKQVASAALWLDELGVGLVVEHDLEPLYGPYRYGRVLVLSLCAVGVVLMIWLTLRTQRDRQRLAGRESFYRQVLDHLPLMVRIRDLHGQVKLENQATRSSEIAKWGSLDLLNAGDDVHMPTLSRLVRDTQRETLQSGRLQERQFVIGDSEVDGAGFRAYRLIGFPIFDIDGRIQGLGSVAVEETEQERDRRALSELAADLEAQVQARTAELVDAKEQAEAATQAKATFLANMSHEIRSPLNAMVGLAHLARRSNREPQVDGYLDKMLKSAEHLQNVVGDILDFSKIEAGEMQIERVAFSLQRLVDSVVDIVWERARGKPLQLILDVDPRLPVQFFGDPLRMVQILINFMDNAIKFTERGSISLRILQGEMQGHRHQLIFEVQDSGVGIAHDRLDEIFKPFQQLDDSITRRYGGSGLGLAICAQLASLMGGQLTARSEVGVGSLFRFSLALEAAPNSLTQSGDGGEVLEGTSLRGRHVLLVEDDPLNREVGIEQLAALGLQVSTAINGADALQRISSDSSIELVLLDVQMPVMDGLETIRRLRPDHPELPVIAMTANNLRGDRERCLDAGMSDYLAKPIDPTHLEALLERWLCRAQQRVVSGQPAKAESQNLPMIDGLDQQAALARLLNNQALYLSLLQRFAEDYADVSQKLHVSLMRGQFDEAQDSLHRFKSLAGTLGAGTLQALSMELELCLREERDWAIAYERFALEFDRQLQAIKVALASPTN
ncbi:response regulator [Stutzerimonas nitrititolerans]|uniref:response regulator n=1 Tax=Stutzerimonas nitrititolerans TaxID=2482751 RepID=UPI003F80F06F